MEDDDIFQSFFYRLNTLFEKLTFVTPESVATSGTAHIQNEPKLEIKVAETERARGKRPLHRRMAFSLQWRSAAHSWSAWDKWQTGDVARDVLGMNTCFWNNLFHRSGGSNAHHQHLIYNLVHL